MTVTSRPIAFSLALLSTVALAIGACSKSSSSSSSSDVPENPTFYTDVAPILNQHCVTCHVAGTIAPFALDSYAEASVQAAAIKSDVVNRIMPPWGPVADGSCQSWLAPRWLSDTEIKTITTWVDQGAKAGVAVPTPTLAPTLELSHVDATIAMPGEFTPAGGSDIYRCFLIDPKVATNQYITGFHIYPGAPQIVHHIIVYTVSSSGASEAAAKSGIDGMGEGYTCFGDAGVDGENWALAWAPGNYVQFDPPTTGVEISAGQKVVMQIHYNLNAGSMPDQTHIDLQLESTVQNPAFIFPLVDQSFSLPKGMASVSDSVSYPLAQIGIPVNLWGLGPHMHLLGRGQQVSVTHKDGSNECLLNQPQYFFKWQQLYPYEAPVTLQPTDTVNITCNWDTVDAVNNPTVWGEDTTDEMCLSIAYVTAG